MKTEKSCQNFERRQSGLKSGGSWIRVKKFRFSRKITEKFRFFQAIIFTKNRFFRSNFRKISIFSGNFTKKFRLSKQKLAIYSYFCANYSISLKKSPLSNILPIHHKI